MPVWRLLDSGDCDAAYNMALDEAISAAVRNGDSPPTLRIYGWQGLSLSLGSFQKITDIDTDFCSANNIPIVRRPTGGRAILHGDELTYSVSARNEGRFSAGLFETYHAISTAFKAALESMGIFVHMKMDRAQGRQLIKSPVCFESTSYGEVSFNNRKLIGSAQRRWSDRFLQQGSIPYSIDYEKLRAVFKRDDNAPAFGTPSYFKRGKGELIRAENEMIGLKEIRPDFSHWQFVFEIKRSFEHVFDCAFEGSGPSPFEEGLAAGLLSDKYLNPEWNCHSARAAGDGSGVQRY